MILMQLKYEFYTSLDRHTCRQAGRQTDRQTDRKQTDSWTDRQTDRQTDVRTDKHNFVHSRSGKILYYLCNLNLRKQWFIQVSALVQG